MALPPGFVLEEEPSKGVQLPPGFQLETAPAAPAVQPEGGFIPSVKRGIAQTGILLGDILPAMAARAVGANEYAERQFREAAATEEKIKALYPAAVPSYKDIKGVGDAITYLTESVGELVPSILPSLVTGGIAGIASRGAVLAAKEAAEAAARKKVAEQGAEVLAKKEVQDEIRQAGIDAARRTALKYDAVGVVGGSALQNVPEVYKNIKDETEQESLGTALLFGGFNSLLDAALPLSVLTKLRKSGIPEEQVIGAWYKRFGVGAAKGFATEGATEAAQEMSSAAAEKFIDNNIDFFSEKNLERFLNAGLKGGLGGGVLSGTTDVVLGKKTLTEDLKPLDEDIRNTQADILARRAFLDELRSQADEEGRNRLDESALKDLGFRKGSLRDSLLNKDINDPAQAQEVRAALTAAINDPAIRGRERAAVNDTLNVINEYVTTREAAPDVGQVVETAGGEGVSVPVGPAEVAAPRVEGVERTGVVPPAPDVAVAPPGEGIPTPPVEAPLEAPVPQVAQAPVQPAPAPEVAVQPAPAPAEAVAPTTRELITEQEAGLAAQMEKFQSLLQEQVKRYGLKEVGVKVIDDLKNANGQYSKGLIQLAIDAADPVRDLKHESVHALKELGFFSPAQWQSLVKQANTTWINTYMRNRDIDGNYLQPGQQSRYDAYINLFKQQGLDDAAIQEAMVEEAIADAFGDFSTAKEKPGMIRALINRMKNFFQSIKESVGMAEVTPERLFTRVERGEVAPPAKPAKPAAPVEVKREEPAAEEKPAEEPKEEAPKYSLRGEVPLSTRTIMEANDDFARADLGLNIKPKRGIANKVRDIGIALNEQTKREQGQMDRQKLTLDNEVAIAKAIADEVAYQLTAGQRKTGTGLGWYSNNYPRAVKRLGNRFPELATNRHARSVFTALVAVTSNGEKVNKNIDNAITLYAKLRNGEPMFAMGNRRATALVNNLQVIQDLLAKHGTDFEKVLLREITVKDMNAQLRAMGQKADTSYLSTTVVPAAAVYFGPKLGAFYANLSGSEGYLTMDLWWTRSINRMRGLLLPKATDASITKFRDMVGDPSMTREDLVAATVPLRNKYEEFGFTTELEHLVKKKEPATKGAKPAWFAQAKRVAGPAYDQLLYDHNLEKMANTIYKNEFEGLEEAPFTANDRAFMYRAGRRAQAMLRSEGIDLTLADIQAALWYYEKRLYEKLSGKKADDIGYEEAIISQADKADRREGPSVVFPERDGRGDVARGEVAGATEVRGEPAEPGPEEVTPKFSIAGPRPEFRIRPEQMTAEMRDFMGGSKAVNADGSPAVYYHGSLRDKRSFRPKVAGAIFFSPEPGFAEGYINYKRKELAERPQQYLDKTDIRAALKQLRQYVYDNYGKQGRAAKSLLEEISNQETRFKEEGEFNFRGELGDVWRGDDTQVGIVEQYLDTGANVTPVILSVKNPFDYEDRNHVAKVLRKLANDEEVKERVGKRELPEGADPTNFMLQNMRPKTKEEFEADVQARYKEGLNKGDWRIIELPEVQRAIRALDYDGFYAAEEHTDRAVKNLAVYSSKQVKSATGNAGPFGQRPPTEEEAARAGMEPEEALRAQEEGDIRFSLRSQVDPAITARMLQTTTARDQKGFVERITDAIGPESRSRFRAAALNRYNRLGEYDKAKLARMGGAELYADANAESAALLSDLGSGIVAGALGVYDKIGGVPVYNRYYAIEKRVPGPQGDQFIQVGGKITDRRVAESLAKRVGGSVKERGYVAVSNKNNTIKGPLAIFAPLAKYGDPDIYRYYQFWAGVKRGEKWMTNAQGQVVKEKLFTPQDIQKAKDLEKQFPEFATIQKEWITYNDALVEFLMDTGVLSKQQAAEFRKHGDYLPFYRQIQGDDDAVGPRIFQPISAVKQPRKLKGGEDPLGDFLENMVRNTQSAVQAGVKNIASRRAADVGMDLDQVKKVTQANADPINSFYVLENGEKVYYDTSDALFIESIKSLGLPDFPGIGLLSAPANVLRNLVTKDPGFMLANMMRDSLAAWTTSGVIMTPIAATLANFTKAVAGQSPEFNVLQMAGIIGGYDYSQGTQEATEQFGKELRRAAGAQTAGEKAMRPFTYLWEGLEKGTQASDAATRIEVYKSTLKETGSEAEALFRALEVMNFNRKGNNPIVRVATAAIPFLNARMQGLDVLYRAAFGKNATKNAESIQKAFWVRGMTLAALSTMYWMLTHDDEEYKRQEQETRDNNWLFPSLGIRIPIPFEVGVLFKVIPERIAALTLGDDTAQDFTKSMARNLMSTLMINPIPQTILPVVEATTNFSFFTFRPIVGQGMEGVAPAYQVGAGTSRLAEGLGGALNISPMKIDQILQGYTGTIGQYMSDMIDAVYDMHTDNPKASKRFEQLPVIKRFVVDPDARGQVTAYFDLKNAVDEATRTTNLLERSMNFDQYGKYMTENIQMLAYKDYVLDLDKTLKQYRDTKTLLRNLPMDADQKRDTIRALTQIENQLTSNIQMLKKQMQ